MQVIILGDVHLGKNLLQGKIGVGSALNSRIVDQINLLDWTLEQAIDKSVEHIIITGDIFEDTKPGTELITLFLSWLKKCQAYQIHVHIIMGNHDILRSGYVYKSPLDIISEVELEYISIYRDINTLLIGCSAFTLVPFRDRKSFGSNTNAEALSILKDSIVYELAGIPITYSKVLIGHLAIEGSIPVGDEIDDITNELFCPVTMFSGYDYVWMGHVHKPQVMNNNDPYVSHIGSMDISNFGETDHKKSIIIFNCDTHTYTSAVIPTRPLIKINVSIPKETVDSTEYVISKIKEIYSSLDRAIVRVDILLESPDIKSVKKSNIENSILELGAFNVSGISESKKITLIKKDSSHVIDIKTDISSAINTYADKYIADKMRSKFIEVSHDILKQYKEDVKE